MPYIPHTKADVDDMLKSINAPSIDALFAEIPESLRHASLEGLPDGLNEMEMLEHAQALAKKNRDTVCFMGAGCYDHHIPAAVWDITSRGEFLTAYTPYQAEASQGTLQLLYEFQTMIAELTGMEVANASLYDGATALAEAILMAVRLKKRHASHKILVPETLHPLYRDTLNTLLAPHDGIELITLPKESSKGVTACSALDMYQNADNISALVIPQPNFWGCLEPVDTLADWAHSRGVMSIACVNPISLGLLKPPGSWGTYGVDITCGEGQPLGIPMAGGGPYLGFFSTRLQHVRQMPGRLVGLTKDLNGKVGYTLTLQAREQHIRRAKATSNICTNQGLLVTAATIHLSLLGSNGLKQVALACHQNTRTLVDKLTSIAGVSLAFDSPFFHEALIQLPCRPEPVIERLHALGINGGLNATPYCQSLENTLLVCATERRTPAEIEQFTSALQTILTELSA